MITWDQGLADGEMVHGVRVFKVCRREAGVPGVRFVWPRWTSLSNAMGRADSDVYYQNCGEYVTGQVGLWCRRHRRKFVYSVASDPDCDSRLPEMCTIRERVLYRCGLRLADRVVVQTGKQQEMLLGGFGKGSVVIPMPCPGPTNGEFVAPPEPKIAGSSILWIGRICRVKRPDRLVELAEMLRECEFNLVGPVGSGEYSREVMARIGQRPNIVVHGRAAREDVPGHYRRAALLVCTSSFEGFPNTFLEAWSHGVPIVSTVDPDGLIEKRGLGRVAGDVGGLVAGIRELLGSPREWRAASANARRYYLENHTVESVMPRFERVFADVLGEGRRAGRN
jgi:glycosyltransferase involved in cell wall biosynthesis